MAYTTIKISPEKLMRAVRAKHFSKADLEREVGASKESVLKWTNERLAVVGVDPDFFRKMVLVLGIKSEDITTNAKPASIAVSNQMSPAERGRLIEKADLPEKLAAVREFIDAGNIPLAHVIKDLQEWARSIGPKNLTKADLANIKKRGTSGDELKRRREDGASNQLGKAG